MAFIANYIKSYVLESKDEFRHSDWLKEGTGM